MRSTLPLREAGRAPFGHRVPVVRAHGGSSEKPGRPRIYLAPLDSKVDQRILHASLAASELGAPRWLPVRRGRVDEDRLRESFLAGDPVLVPMIPPRNGPDRLARLLSWARSAGAEVDLVPVEVLFGPTDHTPSLWNLFLGDPFDPPGPLRTINMLRRNRVRVIIGAPGQLSALSAAAPDDCDDALSLSSFIRGQAIKALSQTERQVFGERYKVPRLVVEQILGEAAFQDRVAAEGASVGLTREESLLQAEAGLAELATRHNRFYMALFHRFTGWWYRLCYEPDLGVDANQVDKLRQLGSRSALIFVPSHKSNLDHLVLYHLLFGSGFPPPHTAAGINMSFFPMSRILPGTGAYFIRRKMGNDPVYRECLRGFIHYLVQRRFHQEFFIEGTRTRSGKLMPPRFGIVNDIVDGARANAIDDAHFVPTAIAYDQVLEVGEYVSQQMGGKKEKESFGFLVRQITKARRMKLGRAHIRFAEPISLREYLDRSGDDRLTVEKLAFRISSQINATTPLTPVSVLCSALLGSRARAHTRAELLHETQRILEFAREHGIATIDDDPEENVSRACNALCDAGLLQTYEGGHVPVYHLTEGGRHAASFYRNTVVHFFLIRAIVHLARAAASGGGDPAGTLGWALRLREILKFEFFFPERAEFEAQVEAERQRLSRELAGPERGPFAAASPRILLDFLESYWVVTETLHTLDLPEDGIEEEKLLERCHGFGRQLLLQDRVRRPELLSSVTFKNALQLAQNLGIGEGRDGRFHLTDRDALATLAEDLELAVRLARRA